MYYNNQTFEYDLDSTKEFFSNMTNFISSNYYVKYITQYINYSTFDHELISSLCLFALFQTILFYTFKTILKTMCTQKVPKINTSTNTLPVYQEYPMEFPNKFAYLSLKKGNHNLTNANKKLTSKNQLLTQENIFLYEIIADIRNILEQNERCARKQTKINNLIQKHFDY